MFDTPQELGEYAASRVLERLQEGLSKRGCMTLGCPGGRSALSTYSALARMLAQQPFDGARLHLLMMDEYVERREGQWQAYPEEMHFSCTGFGEIFIRRQLNTGLERAIPRENLHVPDANNPGRYDDLIAELGGIDAFLLASGQSDGHVAFNPPGTPFEATTRHVELAPTTRKDNMQTFPDFRHLDEVPSFGVSVGPVTIARHSRSAFLILSSSAKGLALRNVLNTRTYDPIWPASVVRECNNAEILADREAVDAMRALPN